MQTLDLNLASRPFRNNTLLWVGHGVAILLLIAFSVWTVRTYRTNAEMKAELNDLLGTTDNQFQQLELRDERARRAIAAVDLDLLEVQADKANQVIDWQAFSWTGLFNRMAEVQPHGVKMIAIRPIFHGGRRAGAAVEAAASQPKGVPVLVEGIGKSDEAVYALQDALISDPYFTRVDPERLVRRPSGEYLFKLRFFYDPQLEAEAAPEARTAAHLPDAAVDGEEVDGEEDESGSDGEAVPADVPDVDVGEDEAGREVGDAWAPETGAGGDDPSGEPSDGDEKAEGAS